MDAVVDFGDFQMSVVKRFDLMVAAAAFTFLGAIVFGAF